MKKQLKYLFIVFFIYSLSLQANATPINIDTLIDKTKKTNQHLLVFFHMTHCGYCKRMERLTLRNFDIEEKLQKKFIYLDINIDDSEKVIFNNKYYTKKEFANNVDVDFYPTVLFFDESADIVYTSRGYRDITKFKKILQFIETKAYERIDFFDFKNEN